MKWQFTLDSLQKKYYLHLNASQSLLKEVDLQKFDGNFNSQTIYYFLDTFNTLTEGTTDPERKAKLLFNTYLAPNIQKLVEPYQNSFKDMTDILIKDFGEIQAIIDAKSRKITTLKYPTNAPHSDIIEYYKTIVQFLLHCETLASCSSVDSAEVLQSIHNITWVKKIASYLPVEIIQQYTKCVNKAAKSAYVTGKEHFTILKSVLTDKWRNMESFADVRNRRSTYVDNSNTKSYNDKPKNNYNTFNNKSQGILAFPCPFHQESTNGQVAKHELGHCRAFFSGNNSARLKLCKVNKVCTSCLRHDCLKHPACVADLPEGFICSQCRDGGYKRPNNVTICTHTKHSKPSFDELCKLLESHLKVLDATLLAQYHQAYFDSGD